MRHAKTKLNLEKNLFIGQKLNPKIIPLKQKPIKKKYKKVFSSELLRCIQTAKLLSKNPLIKYALLNEIDYGDIEGKSLTYVQNNYNYIISAWSKGRDIKFPNGENYHDVVKRLNLFKAILKKYIIPKENYLVVTHNVILRVMLGLHFDIKMCNWYQLNISHLGFLKFIIVENKIYPEIDRKKFINQIYG